MAEKLPIKLDTLRNKSVIITGGASGLGLATATKFAESGAYVTIADIQEEAGQKAASELRKKGYQVTFVRTDVADWTSSVVAFKHAIEFSPRKTLDVAGLFAGIVSAEVNLPKEIASLDPEPSLDRDPVQPNLNIIRVNLIGVYNCTRLALHYFRLKPAADEPGVAPGKKSLILVSSLSGYCDHPPTEYSTAKFGVRGLFRSIRWSSLEGDSEFRVNVLAPGLVASPGVLALPPPDDPKSWIIDFATDKSLWVPIEHVVDAASLCATNEDVNGKSFSIWPHGFFDNMEDRQNGDGAPVLMEHMRKSGYLKAIYRE